MVSKKLPSISVLIPTLNAARVLESCLKSIIQQDYPKGKIEIIIADGGSTDKTLEIARKYGAKILKNPLKTGEAGKAVALKKAKNELVALIDSDNILPSRNWFKKMVKPFKNSEIIVSEPIRFTWRKKGGIVERYSALIGMNDPLCLFLGNYDRQNRLTGKWTGVEHQEEDKGGYLKVKLTKKGIPTVGANGTLFRKRFLGETEIGSYLFDIDLITKEIEKKGFVYVAKVKVGIIHTFCENSIKKFVRKQNRRVKDYLYYNQLGARSYSWKAQSLGIFKFILFCVGIVPLFFQSVRGFLKKKDVAWLLHPLMCWITLIVYSVNVSLFKSGVVRVDSKRRGWQQ